MTLNESKQLLELNNNYSLQTILAQFSIKKIKLQRKQEIMQYPVDWYYQKLQKLKQAKIIAYENLKHDQPITK